MLISDGSFLLGTIYPFVTDYYFALLLFFLLLLIYPEEQWMQFRASTAYSFVVCLESGTPILFNHWFNHFINDTYICITGDSLLFNKIYYAVQSAYIFFILHILIFFLRYSAI